jgi:uncharacterized protein YkwD
VSASSTVRAAIAGATVAAVTVASAGIGATPATATPATAAAVTVDHVRLNSYEARLLTDINQVRRRHHLRPLIPAPRATDLARSWSWHIARQQTLAHDPGLLGDLIAAGRLRLADVEENVGFGPVTEPDRLFEAYMHSAPHRANILGRRVRYVGIGVVQRGTYAWNTIDFANTNRPSYGPPRVPAAGIAPDSSTLTRTTMLTSGARADQRLGARRARGTTTSRVRFSRGAAHVQLTSRRGRGHGSMIFRQELSLRQVRALRVSLGATGRSHSPVRVAIRIGTGWRSHLLRVVRVRRMRSVTVRVPRRDRGIYNTIRFTVTGRTIAAQRHRVTLSAADLTAIVG